MAIETKTREIRGLQVHTTQLPVRKAYKLAPKIGMIIAPALGELPEGLDLESDVSALGPAFSKLFSALDDAEQDNLMEALLQGTSVVVPNIGMLSLSTPEHIDTAFAGNLMALMQTLWFALEVNFADFFEGASQIKESVLRAAAMKKAEQESSSPES